MPPWRKKLRILSWDPRAVKEDLTRFGNFSLQEGYPFSRLTTYRIGGPADLLVEVNTREELSFLLSYLSRHEIPYFVLGGGSNLLVRDGGFRGVVIRLGRGFREIDLEEDGKVMFVKVGASLPTGALIRMARIKGWEVLKDLAGTPGTIGGAVRMNAGTQKVGIMDFAEKMEVMLPAGESVLIERKRIRYGYRYTEIPRGSVILTAFFRFPVTDPESARKSIDAYLDYRRRTQPLRQPSAGSVFKNPPEIPAGEVIERLGLKGVRLYDAQISPKHGNFIVNLGSARSRDVLALVRLCKVQAKEEMGIHLEEEIEIVGVEEEDLRYGTR
jgi:UDP-N-acetylmuramate dehydrogenase